MHELVINAIGSPINLGLGFLNTAIIRQSGLLVIPSLASASIALVCTKMIKSIACDVTINLFNSEKSKQVTLVFINTFANVVGVFLYSKLPALSAKKIVLISLLVSFGGLVTLKYLPGEEIKKRNLQDESPSILNVTINACEGYLTGYLLSHLQITSSINPAALCLAQAAYVLFSQICFEQANQLNDPFSKLFDVTFLSLKILNSTVTVSAYTAFTRLNPKMTHVLAASLILPALAAITGVYKPRFS
jgi:hypothetical protein